MQLENPSDRRAALEASYASQLPDRWASEKEKISFHIGRLRDMALTLNALSFVSHQDTIDLAWLRRGDLFIGITLCSGHIDQHLPRVAEFSASGAINSWKAFRYFLDTLNAGVTRKRSTQFTGALLYFTPVLLDALAKSQSGPNLDFGSTEEPLRNRFVTLANALAFPLFQPGQSITEQLANLAQDLTIDATELRNRL